MEGNHIHISKVNCPYRNSVKYAIVSSGLTELTDKKTETHDDVQVMANNMHHSVAEVQCL